MDLADIFIFFPFILALFLLFAILKIFNINLFLQAKAAGVDLNIASLFGMKLRGVDPKKVVNSFILARKANLDVNLEDCEICLLTGKDPQMIITKLIQAKKNGFLIDMEAAISFESIGYKTEDIPEFCCGNKPVSLTEDVKTSENEIINCKITLEVNNANSQKIEAVPLYNLLHDMSEEAEKIAGQNYKGDLLSNSGDFMDRIYDNCEKLVPQNFPFSVESIEIAFSEKSTGN
jgi:hypothetical protein